MGCRLSITPSTCPYAPFTSTPLPHNPSNTNHCDATVSPISLTLHP